MNKVKGTERGRPAGGPALATTRIAKTFRRAEWSEVKVTLVKNLTLLQQLPHLMVVHQAITSHVAASKFKASEKLPAAPSLWRSFHPSSYATCLRKRNLQFLPADQQGNDKPGGLRRAASQCSSSSGKISATIINIALMLVFYESTAEFSNHLYPISFWRLHLHSVWTLNEAEETQTAVKNAMC